MKTLLKAIFFFLVSNQVHAIFHIEPYVNFGMGFEELDETINSTTVLDHNITSPRLGFGSRLGVDIKNLGLGAIGEIQWQHLDGRRSDQSGFFIWEKEGYDASVRNLLYGAYLSYKFSALRIIGEYYPAVSGKVTYADTETQNPFLKEDELAGQGFGLGLGAEAKSVSFGVMLRRVIYDELKRQGVTTSLPSSQFTKITDDSVTFQFGIIF